MENTIINSKLWQKWIDFIYTNFEISIENQSINLFELYLKELTEWNAKINLISNSSPEEILWRHFADSISSLYFINKYSSQKTDKIIDLGTGAGFPGYPVKIARQDLNLTLVESITKKCSFLENIKYKLHLSDVTILNTRAEELGHEPKLRANFDFVLSRAVTKFSPNLEIAIPFLKPGGTAIIYKTKRSLDGEGGLASIKNALKILGAELEDQFFYNIPGAEYEYCILAFKKISNTQALYPRRSGIPEKKSL